MASSQANRAMVLRPCGGEKARPIPSATIGAPIAMNGIRRPQRERVLSDQEPSMGSATASTTRAIPVAAPTKDPGRPRSAV